MKQKNKLKKFPYWIKYGLLIFPILLILSLIFLISIFKTNPLFWMIIPSIIFEEVFENCCYSFSNNLIANSIFIIIFWFLIGALVGILIQTINNIIFKK